MSVIATLARWAAERRGREDMAAAVGALLVLLVLFNRVMLRVIIKWW
jgi:hypothetical protein